MESGIRNETHCWRGSYKYCGTICLLVEDAQISHIRDKTTAKSACDALKAYHEKASGIKKFTLTVDLLQLKSQDEEDLEKHLAKTQKLTDNLLSLGDGTQWNLVLGSSCIACPRHIIPLYPS